MASLLPRSLDALLATIAEELSLVLLYDAKSNSNRL